MNIKIHDFDNIKIAELISDKVEIQEVQDAVDLLGNSGYLGAEKIIVRKEQLCPDFFDLKTGIAGDILQKFSNYNKQLAIVGDFTEYTSKSLRHFIRESNKTGRILFVSVFEEAKIKLLRI